MHLAGLFETIAGDEPTRTLEEEHETDADGHGDEVEIDKKVLPVLGKEGNQGDHHIRQRPLEARVRD
jgi:hypothetical protein